MTTAAPRPPRPTRAELRRKALLAAASVTLAAGCAGAPGAVTADTDARADTGASQAKPDCVALELDVNACCDALHAWCGEHVAENDPASYDACVFGPDFSGATGCIPWGPPVPPRARVLA